MRCAPYASAFERAGFALRPTQNESARVGQASMHEPQAMQSPARTMMSRSAKTGSNMAGSHRQAFLQASQWMQAAWSRRTFTWPARPTAW